MARKDKIKNMVIIGYNVLIIYLIEVRLHKISMVPFGLMQKHQLLSNTMYSENKA